MKLSEHQLQELADGITVTLSESECVRFLVEPDYGTEINDWDCYGRTEWTRDNVYSGHNVRPATFTGRAVKILTDRGSTLWWEPPCFSKEDARQWHTDAQYRRDMLRMVRDIVEYGFSVFRVEYCRGVDAYGHGFVAAYTTLGGIEPNTRPETVVEYLRDMVAELAVSDAEVSA